MAQSIFPPLKFNEPRPNPFSIRKAATEREKCLMRMIRILRRQGYRVRRSERRVLVEGVPCHVHLVTRAYQIDGLRYYRFRCSRPMEVHLVWVKSEKRLVPLAPEYRWRGFCSVRTDEIPRFPRPGLLENRWYNYRMNAAEWRTRLIRSQITRIRKGKRG